VRPINVHLLRVIYFLMIAFVATEAWRTILTREGVRAAKLRDAGKSESGVVDRHQPT
jgi:hypothetical protein